jgi:hypothetical protein
MTFKVNLGSQTLHYCNSLLLQLKVNLPEEPKTFCSKQTEKIANMKENV